MIIFEHLTLETYLIFHYYKDSIIELVSYTNADYIYTGSI